MNRPSCFHVTNKAIVGMASFELISHDGLGARGPSK